MPHKNLFRTIKSESELRNLLVYLSLTDNIEILHKIFSNIGYCLLSNPQHCESIIKFKPLYDKILLVLNQGPITKTKLTLNLLSTLMLAESSQSQNKREALKMHAQNMIRISGCLAALCIFFTNSMLQHETWIALCQGLSETCYKSVLNQNYCTHLVPLCVQRCRRSNTEVLLVLHSLLVHHDRNIKVFYESDGMSIFSRDNLLYTPYLRTLNTVIEGTKPSHRDFITNSTAIFQRLRRWALAHSGSAVTQWAVVILYSRRKLLGADSEFNDEAMDCEDDSYSEHNDFELDAVQDASRGKLKPELIDNPNSDTCDLFRNVMKEVYDYKHRERQTKRIPQFPLGFKGNSVNEHTHLFKLNRKEKSIDFLNSGKNTYRQQGSAIFQRGLKQAAGDLSFSFLMNESRDANCRKQRKKTFSLKRTSEHLAPLDFRDKSRLAQNSYRPPKTVGDAINSQSEAEYKGRETPRQDTFGRTTCTFNEHEHNSDEIDFRPQRVSTPIRLRCSRKRNTTSRTVIRDATFKTQSRKCVKNSSVTSKFMDIINGSCTTIARGIGKIKNVFAPKSVEAKEDDKVMKESNNSTRRIDCSYSFTNYMNKRDAISRRAKSGSKEVSIFSDGRNSCPTCNDTEELRHKLVDNSALKECVRKLKLGINLYGCDFKKISRILWPREPYMTPKVLYTLYRKLIANN